MIEIKRPDTMQEYRERIMDYVRRQAMTSFSVPRGISHPETDCIIALGTQLTYSNRTLDLPNNSQVPDNLAVCLADFERKFVSLGPEGEITVQF